MPARSGPGPHALDAVTAVVLTFRRRQLAGDVTRSLIEIEGFDPGQVVVVVNGEGGLDDPALEQAVRMIRLPANLGPAAGFDAGLRAAFADPAVDWAYLCEDDVGLFDLPAPRVAELLARVHASATAGPPIGAVVAYGRRFSPQSGHAVNVVPPPGVAPQDLVPVDGASWGATLVARAVIDAGVHPDPAWFFGYEDFDFFLRVHAAGFAVLVDAVAARAVADQQTTVGRARALGARRPVDAEEAWRAYYVARNFFALARRHGRPRWLAWHAAYSLRRLQLAGSGAERRAYLHGLWDGLLGRMGANPRYRREVGELPTRPPPT